MSKATAVVLSIYSKIQMNGEEPETVDLTTEGKFYAKEDALYFVYEETDLSGMAGDRTTIKIKPDEIVMRRYGANTSELVFKQGRRFETLYHTAYGDFEMEILSQEVYSDVDLAGVGEVRLKYQLSIKGIGETRTVMTVRSRLADSTPPVEIGSSHELQ